MTDVRLAWAEERGYADICLDGADLAGDDGLATAVLVSLFTDRRVSADELPPGETSRRGWWGDVLEEDDEIGSKLWLLSREKQTDDVLVRAEAYSLEALAWMVEDAVASSVEVVTEWTQRGVMTIRVPVTLPDGSTREFQFSDALRVA